MSKTKTYTLPPDNCYKEVFAIVRTGTGTFVCPGWHPIPEGTVRDQIKFSKTVNTSKKKTPPTPPKPQTKTQSWNVNGSKKGVVYQVTESNDRWDCTCPAKNFFRGDCKHIKAKKQELILA